MARILITSGPTRQHLDPVRDITNASSGRMGQSLAQAAIDAGQKVVIVSCLSRFLTRRSAKCCNVVSTEEMLATCQRVFPSCDGLIGVASPSDYRPMKVEEQKIKKTGEPLLLQLIETPDIVATLAGGKRPEQWLVGSCVGNRRSTVSGSDQDAKKKSCDLMVLNGPEAMMLRENTVEVLDKLGEVVAAISGAKDRLREEPFGLIEKRLVR